MLHPAGNAHKTKTCTVAGNSSGNHYQEYQPGPVSFFPLKYIHELLLSPSVPQPESG